MHYLLIFFAALFFAPTISVKGKRETHRFNKHQENISGKDTSNTSETTFIVVRHAEKIASGTDPDLSSEGRSRAENLSYALSKINVSAIYSTPFKRTRQTVQLLADKRKLQILEYSPTLQYDSLIKMISASNPGQVVVVAGHSNTVPEILKALTNGNFVTTIGEEEYDNLFIVTAEKSRGRKVMHLKYGM